MAGLSGTSVPMPLCRRITKGGEHSNPVFSEFHRILWCGSYKPAATLAKSRGRCFFMSVASQASRDRANRLPGIMFRLKEQLVPDASERYVK